MVFRDAQEGVEGSVASPGPSGYDRALSGPVGPLTSERWGT